MNNNKAKNDALYDRLILNTIFTFMDRTQWLTIKLTCKRWNIIGNLTFDPGSDDNYALYWSVCNNKTQLINNLISDNRVNASCHNNITLRWAIKNGNICILKKLINDPRVDINTSGNLPIIEASKFGNIPILELMFNNKYINISEIQNVCISWAINNNHFDVIYLFLNNKHINFDILQINPIVFSAVKNNRIDILNIMLNKTNISYNTICAAIKQSINIYNPLIITMLLTYSKKHNFNTSTIIKNIYQSQTMAHSKCIIPTELL